MTDLSTRLQERLLLRIDREIGTQMDSIIEKVILIARDYSLGQNEATEKSANSPFKNVLNVSVEPSSSLEVIKNFIRYQTGRKGGSEIWKKKGFADALVTNLDKLSQDANEILQRILDSHQKKDIDGEISPEHPLVQYINDNNLAIKRALHLQLAQLYLGYLSREHIASKGGVPGKVESSSVDDSSQRTDIHSSVKNDDGKNKPVRPKKRGKR